MSEPTILLSGLRWTIIATGINFIIGLLQTALLARLLEKTEFAWIAIAAVFINIGTQIQNTGINTALIQRPENTHAQLSSLYWLNQMIGVVLLLLGFTFAWLIGNWYQSTSLTNIFVLYSFIFIVNGLGVQYKAILQKNFRFQEMAVIETIATLGGFIVALWLAWQGWGAASLIISYLVRSIIETIGSLYIGKRIFMPTWYFQWKDVKIYGNFSAILTLERLVTHFVSQLDILLISKWLGMEAAGVYDVFKRVLMRPSVLLNISMERVLLPVLSKLQYNKEQLGKTYFNLLNLSLSIHLPIYLLAIILAPWLVEWYFGVSWNIYTPVFQWMCGLVLVFALFNPVESLLLAIGRIQIQLFLYLIMAPLLTIFIYVSSQYGLAKTIAFIIVIQLIIAVIAYLLILKKYSFAESIGIATKPFLLLIASSGISFPIYLFSVPLAGIVFIILYLYMTYRFNYQSVSLLRTSL